MASSDASDDTEVRDDKIGASAKADAESSVGGVMPLLSSRRRRGGGESQHDGGHKVKVLDDHSNNNQRREGLKFGWSASVAMSTIIGFLLFLLLFSLLQFYGFKKLSLVHQPSKTKALATMIPLET